MHVDGTMDLSDTEVSTAGDWMQALELFEDENERENSSDDNDGSETNDVRCKVPRIRRYREGHEDKAGRALELCCRNSSIFQIQGETTEVASLCVSCNLALRRKDRKPRMGDEIPPLFIPS